MIAVPCNQFGHQENGSKQEIITSLFHIRPGNEYVPNFPLSTKLEVNGANAHALFQQLRHALPFPSDRDFGAEASNPQGVFTDPLRVLWKPLSRTDISWNFEKFLIGKDGVPAKRFSPSFETIQLKEEIQALVNGCRPSAL